VSSPLDIEHDLWAEVARHDAARPRSRQVKLGCSEIGGCRRYAGYRLHGVARTDPPGEKRAAALGTWIHKGVQAVMVQAFDAFDEVAVETPDLLSSSDLYFPDGVVEDDKTCDDMMLPGYMEHGPPRRHWWQVMKYADLIRQGLFASTETRLAGPQLVTDVRIRYIGRSRGGEHVVQEPFDPDVVAEADAWLEEVKSYADPDGLPQDEPGPGISYICDSCPFATRCWGPERADGRRRQANMVRDDADVRAALEEYAAARAVESEAKRRKARARALLDAAQPGTYGPWYLGWSGVGKEPRQVDDVEAMRARLAELGEPIPVKELPPPNPSIVVNAAE
jgi:hypothetical protein